MRLPRELPAERDRAARPWLAFYIDDMQRQAADKLQEIFGT
jgi:hypothetical protein